MSAWAERLVAQIIEVEGEYVFHPNDKGGPTKYGITLAVARANGYTGPIRDLPKEAAERIYRQKYITGPGFDWIAPLSEKIAAELADSGVNMGPTVPIVWLQRWLNAFNRQGKDYPDITVDGAIGPKTLAALQAFLDKRGYEGERVLHAALNCSQGARYLDLSEAREKNESFLYGWLRARVLDQLGE